MLPSATSAELGEQKIEKIREKQLPQLLPGAPGREQDESSFPQSLTVSG